MGRWIRGYHITTVNGENCLTFHAIFTDTFQSKLTLCACWQAEITSRKAVQPTCLKNCEMNNSPRKQKQEHTSHNRRNSAKFNQEIIAIFMKRAETIMLLSISVPSVPMITAWQQGSRFFRWMKYFYSIFQTVQYSNIKQIKLFPLLICGNVKIFGWEFCVNILTG